MLNGYKRVTKLSSMYKARETVRKKLYRSSEREREEIQRNSANKSKGEMVENTQGSDDSVIERVELMRKAGLEE